ncbi:MAG: hypothetical protein OEZ31_02330 [Nitrospirota bacterium]|nr:hypothetical protein [Nitrospirota bacterium]MDH5767783.1 hypothetical protein [Nitrospirota bacterium]
MASSSCLKPREKGKVTARVNIKGEEGFISSVVRVVSNDPMTPVVTLFIEAMIEDTQDTPVITEK